MNKLEIVVLLFTSSFFQNSNAQQRAFKFDFGSGKAAPGYTQVTPTSIFNESNGFGFSEGVKLESVDRGGNSLTGDFITSKHPFYFSVRLPEGNYDVKLILGDSRGTSATTVRVECRRLMLENVKTKKGKLAFPVFTVHVKDSLIRKEGESIRRVRLKDRERNYRHWDNLLTIEFNDSLPKVGGLEIIPNPTATTIFLAGNSTVVDQDREPWAAWGQMLPVFLVPSKVAVANYAESGETMKAFQGERRLEKIWSLAKPGDYLFIEFTHNDQKPGGNHLDPFTTYQQMLKTWIDEARKREVIPVLVTSMHRRNFDESGKIVNTLLEYPEAARQTAASEKVALIDLNAMSQTLYESWGPDRSLKAFVHFPANTFPNQTEALKDNTHFSTYGAYELARCVVSSIRQQRLSLEKYVRKDFPKYNPANPMAFEKFYWPPSTFMAIARPDGN
ncbi:MAG: rhamnogalacturonan acetylesterase [Chitinophagaceae bacterium]|nr:rhamnogalacturonan acetylesterase [Chitinophagaceae bacterium]